MKLDGLGSLLLRVSSMRTVEKRNGADTSVAKETPQEKWLREWREAMAQQAPVKQIESSRRQVAANKVGLLKQRLEAIKALLRFATPEMAKRLASELKSIASELASIARTLGSGSSGGGPSMATAGVSPASSASATTADQGETGAAAGATGVANATAVDATATSQDNESPDGKDRGTAYSVTATSEPATVNGSQDSRSDDDAALKALLRDARKLLKEAIDQLKARLARHPDHDMKHDVEAAEKGLADMDKALSQSDAAILYTGPGNTADAATSSLPSGQLIDLSV